MCEVQVPANNYCGAQTERSRNNFKIGPKASMPVEIIATFAYLKKAAAYANTDLGVLTVDKRNLITAGCDEILEGKLPNEFPLVIWQTGSGTQSNMNVNEVIANRAHVAHGGALSEGKTIIHLNDDVNKSQSSASVLTKSFISLKSRICSINWFEICTVWVSLKSMIYPHSDERGFFICRKFAEKSNHFH